MPHFDALNLLFRSERLLKGVPLEARPVFLDIAQNPGTNILDAVQRLDITVARVMRMVAKLSGRNWLWMRGLDPRDDEFKWPRI